MQMQTQTNPMNPQGLAGLMQGMPQGQPNPMQPTPATPGSVNQIKNTYGVNTVPRDLKALMALNEALQMVQSADRNAQLQAQIPQESVKDQMTSAAQDILQQAQGVAGASQQQEAEKQAALQRLAQGIAAGPSANQVMPQNMAMGGVVSFQSGGAAEALPVIDQREVQRILKKGPATRTKAENDYLQRAGVSLTTRQMGSSEATPSRSIAEILQGLRGPVSDEPIADKLTRIIRGGSTPPSTETAPQVPTFPGKSGDPDIDVGVTQPAPPVARPAPGATPGAGVAALPRRSTLDPSTMGQGITLPGAAAPQRDVVPELGARARGSALPMGMQQGVPEDPMKSILGRVDPEALRAAAEGRAKAVYDMSPEEKRIYEERLARMRKEAAPKDTRWYERLGDLAARYANRPVQGTNVGALGGIASVGAELGKERLTEQQRRQAEIDALQEKYLAAQRASREKTFEAGEAAFGKGMEHQGKIGTIGADIRGQDVRAETEAAGIAARAKEGELDRQAKERIAQLDATVRERIARMEALARAGDQQTQREIQRINAAMNDPRLKKLGELAAVSPDKYQTKYETAITEALERVAPGLYGKKPPPAGGAAKPDDPLGIRK